MRRKIENTLIYGCGGFVIGIGVLGLFLPIIQGIVLIALGLYIISFRSERAKRLLDCILNKFPFIHTVVTKFSTYSKSFVHKMGMFF